MKSKLDFIENFDMFGKRIELYYDGKQKKKSLIGIIFTLVYLIVFAFIFIYKLVRFIKRTEYVIYDTYVFSGKPSSIQLSNENFYVGFALEEPVKYNEFIDETIYYPKAYYKKAVRNGEKWEWFVKELEIERCKIEKFGNLYRNIFKGKPINNLYCFKEMNESLTGHFSFDNYSLFFISFFPCINTTENNNHCKSKKEIDYYLKGTFVSFHMQDIEMNPQQYDLPIIPRDKDAYTTIGKKIFKEIHALFQIVQIQTDLDMFGIENFRHIRNNEYIKFESLTVMSNVIENDIYVTGESFCDVSFKLSDKILLQKRTFTKFTDILGNIGGFMQFTFCFLKIICSFSTRILYETSLVNHLFEFNIDKKLIYYNRRNRKSCEKNLTLHPKLYIPVRSYRKPTNTNDSINENKINNTDDQLNVVGSRKQSIFSHKPKKKTTELKLKPLFTSNYKDFENKKKLIKCKLNYEDNDKNKKNVKSDINIFNFNMKFQSSNNNNGIQKRKDTLIKRLQINGLCIYFCFFYVRRRKNVQNILLDEGVRIIVEQLDLVNIFKKLYKEEKTKEKKLKDTEIIKMSNDCRIKLDEICHSFYKS